MVYEGLCDWKTVSDLGSYFSRPVCIRNESQDCSHLHLESQSTGLSDRRIVNCMGKHGGICFSANMSHSESHSAHEEFQVPNDPDSTPIAEEALVHQSSSNVHCIPMKLPAVQDLLTQPKTEICHPNPQIFRLAAWLLSTYPCKIKDFQLTLESSWLYHGDQAPGKTNRSSLTDSVAGIVNGKLIPMLQLWQTLQTFRQVCFTRVWNTGRFQAIGLCQYYYLLWKIFKLVNTQIYFVWWKGFSIRDHPQNGLFQNGIYGKF